MEAAKLREIFQPPDDRDQHADTFGEAIAHVQAESLKAAGVLRSSTY